jgi:hypothetical protein
MCATEASAAAVDAPGDGCGLGGQMAADAYEERFQPYDDILRSLTAMLVAQRTMNEEQRAMNQRVEGFMQRQDTINERLTAAIERLDTTQARIETLLARVLRSDDNGWDA